MGYPLAVYSIFSIWISLPWGAVVVGGALIICIQHFLLFGFLMQQFSRAHPLEVYALFYLSLWT